MVMNGRAARLVEDLDDDTLKTIARSSVSPDHDALNSLIEDWVP
jgi:hypothetical protein